MSTSVRRPHHCIRLNNAARADLAWWIEFLPHWNGLSFLLPDLPLILVTSDALGSWGCGAFVESEWFQIQWPDHCSLETITQREMIPVLLAAAIWGRQWSQKLVCFRSDNMAVVSALSTGTARDKMLLHLLRCLHFYSAMYNFSIIAHHIPGNHNHAADALSRNRINDFFLFVPQASPNPTNPPEAAMGLALKAMDWTSPRWREKFTSSLIME